MCKISSKSVMIMQGTFQESDHLTWSDPVARNLETCFNNMCKYKGCETLQEKLKQ